MIRRLLSACLGAALVSALGVSARSAAKPPDLPNNPNDTVAPKAALEVEEPLCPQQSPASTGITPFIHAGVKKAPGTFANDQRPNAHPLLTPGIYYRAISSVFFHGDQEEVEESSQPSMVESLAEEELPPAPPLYDALPVALPTPALYQLRPTARRTLVGSLLFGINPLLALLPTDKALDGPDDHPQCVAGEDILKVIKEIPDTEPSPSVRGLRISNEGGWRFGDGSSGFKWLRIYCPAMRAAPSPEQNEGYLNAIYRDNSIAGLTPADAPAGEVDSPLTSPAERLPMPSEDVPHKKKKHKNHHPKAERLPMPRQDDSAGITCPYLRQQAADRHACQLADPDIGREVLDNLERLKEAEGLLTQAEAFVQAGRIDEALGCCDRAREMCQGSPCAARADAMFMELSFIRFYAQPAGAEDAAEEKPDHPPSETQSGVEEQVRDLMKAYQLLMCEGLHEQAAELARQAFALDSERVMADPLFYKMHLLATTPARSPADSSESSEPPSCPYCPPPGKPITGIVPDKKKSAPGLAELAEVIAGEPGHPLLDFHIGADGGVRLCGQCTCGGTVYHIKYNRGCLAIWKTPDAAKAKP
jgi:hypothetical protein